jgi:hypothetical protein
MTWLSGRRDLRVTWSKGHPVIILVSQISPSTVSLEALSFRRIKMKNIFKAGYALDMIGPFMSDISF